MKARSRKNRPEASWLDKYKEYLVKNGLKSTVQRDLIVSEFFRSQGHISAEELHKKLREEHSSIGLATIYRTLKLLTLAGLAHERRFNNGYTRYEFYGPGDAHHDHIVCVSCDKVEEFQNDEIESLQRQVASRHKFKMFDHKLEIYGLCSECSSKEAGKK